MFWNQLARELNPEVAKHLLFVGSASTIGCALGAFLQFCVLPALGYSG